MLLPITQLCDSRKRGVLVRALQREGGREADGSGNGSNPGKFGIEERPAQPLIVRQLAVDFAVN